MQYLRQLWGVLLLGIAIGGCQDARVQESQDDLQAKEVWTMPDTAKYKRYGHAKLSDYGLFTGKLAELKVNTNVFPYELNSPLFSDYALKKRFIYLPEGKAIGYDSTQVMNFPVGAILIKNFFYDSALLAGNRIIETRLLIREEKGWKALPYLWNEEQTEAYLEITGRTIPLTLTNGKKPSYSVPDMMQCKGCHNSKGKIVPIGPTARQLNRDNDGKNQIAALVAMGWLKNVPNPHQWPAIAQWDDPNAPLNDRARAYLDINCGHCHSDTGQGKTSGLDLTITSYDPLNLGIYKAPIAAGKGSGGLVYDIVPGHPEKSILLFRMNSNDPGVMMPELGRSVIHDEGVELIKAWIAQMEN